MSDTVTITITYPAPGTPRDMDAVTSVLIAADPYWTADYSSENTPKARWWSPSMPPGGRSLRPPLPALAAARAQGGRPASAAPRHRYRSNRPRSPMVPTERYAADQHRDASTRSGAPGAGRQRPWGHGHPLRTGSAVGRADRSKSRSGTDLTEFAGTNAPVGGAGHATPRLLVVGGRPRSR
jgi:hypothetical protein